MSRNYFYTGLLILLLSACKKDCPISDCPQNQVPNFRFSPVDQNGLSLYKPPQAAYNIKNLEITAIYPGGQEKVAIDTNTSRYNKVDYFVISAKLPRATTRFLVHYQSNKFDQFAIESTQSSSECCGSFYTGFSIFFNNQKIESFSPYLHVVN